MGTLGAATIVFPLAPAIASADTPAPAVTGSLTGSRSDGSHASRGARVVHVASKQWGHPYVYGTEGPVAFDCSALTKYVYSKVDVQLPHNSAAQYEAVDHVSKSDMRLGDLVFFYDNSGIYHVGIYAGDHQMWAASHTGDYVKKQAIYTDQFVVGRP